MIEKAFDPIFSYTLISDDHDQEQYKLKEWKEKFNLGMYWIKEKVKLKVIKCQEHYKLLLIL